MNIRASLLVFAAIVGPALSQEVKPIEFGQWKVGMSRTEAIAVRTHGVPEKVTGSSETYRIPNLFTFLDQEGELSYTIRGEKVGNIVFSFIIPDFSIESRLTAYGFAERIAGHFELKDREEFVGTAKSSIDKICDAGIPRSGVSSVACPGLTLGYQILSSGGYACLVIYDPDMAARQSSFTRMVRPVGPANTTTKGGVPNGTRPSPKTDAELAPTMTGTGQSYQVPGKLGKTFSRSLGSINALLVRPLEDGRNAASAMKLTVTVIQERTDGMADFAFNQEVGDDMRRATEEVVRAVILRNGEFPPNTNVRFGFADKWGGKDGPSAAVACAVLLESVIHGFEIPGHLAVTGDLNADSTVQPVGGVADKIRGAMDAGCHLIGIPAANEEDITDLIVEENLRRFLSAKVFTLVKLDEALALADPSRMTEEARAALTDLDAAQKELSNRASAIYSPDMQQRLTVIQTALPNCYTAKILAAAGRRSLPVRYSLVGTLMRIDEAMAPFSESLTKIKEGTPVEEFRFGRDNPIQEAKNRLSALRSRSDERLVGVIDAQKGLVDQFQRIVNADIGSTSVLKTYLNELEKAEIRANEAWKKIRDNRDIQDQFMKRGISID